VLKALQPEQLELLNEVVEATEEVLVGGVPVSIAMVEVDRYYEEAAYVVHRWMETFEIPVGAVLLVRPPHINVILRCRLEDLDIGRVAQAIGGGGHPTAASAHVVDRMPVELREELLQALEQEMPPPVRALEVASRQIFTVGLQDTVAAAKERLNKLRVNALPVQDGDELVGVLTRQTLDRAIGHALGERPVSSVMQPSVPTVDASTSLEELGDLFLERSFRFVVVTRDGRPAGVVTRMDLLRRLFARQHAVGSSLDNRMAGARAVRQSIGRMLRELTPDWVRALLEQVRQVADAQGVPVYLVGGIVRDLLLARPNEDLDLVVEGDGVAFARALVEAAGGRCHPHTPFMTAVVTLADGNRVDVASARTEFYRTPAAMPEVMTSLIRQDLYRRDFTINALAVALFGDRHGDLVDFFGGRKDVRRKEIRVLHSLSFIDDPTRAIRAVRYARRLGFAIAADTRHLIRTAVAENVFARLSGQRLRRELQHLLAETHPAQSLALLAELGLMPAVLPDLEWSESLRAELVEVENQLAWFELQELGEPPPPWLLYLGGLAVRAGGVAAERLADRLQLAGALHERLARLPAQVDRVSEAASLDLLRSARVRRVEDTPVEAVLLAMAGLELERRRILADALEASVRVVVPVRGGQLVAAGIEPGPHIGQALRQTRDAMVDGVIGAGEALQHAVEAAAVLAEIRPAYPINPT
jgi:tRNA nucleotidyltransferase (CCA-adding enzyme)